MSNIYTPSSIPLRIPFAPNRGFNFTKPIRVTNRTTKLTDYQIDINLNTSNFAFEKARSDGADIRFQDANGKALSYWIESWSATSAKIWVKLDELEAYEDRIIWLIYGRYDGVNESNGDNTFTFFDDFLGSSLDTNKWSRDTAYASVSDSILTFYKSTDVYLESLRFEKPQKLRTKTRFSTVSSGNYGYCGFTFRSDVNQYANIQSYSNAKRVAVYDGAYTTTAITNDITSWFTYDVFWKTNEVKHYVDDVLKATHTSHVPNVDLPAGLYSSDAAVYVDWIFIHKYSLVSPLVEIL